MPSISPVARRFLPLTALAAAAAAVVLGACRSGSGSTVPPVATATPTFVPGNLLVTRSTYDPTFTVSGTLPYNATPTTANSAPVAAVSPGTFPNVFTNDANDPNFGVTTAILMDQWAPGTTSPMMTTNLSAKAQAAGTTLSTSFGSKSELGLAVSSDRRSLAFMAYTAAANQLDISNSNTPGVVDTTNTDTAPATYRTVAQFNLADGSLQTTPTNAYSGNNGRAAVLANGLYYLVGNAGNSGKNPKPTTAQLDFLSEATGVQSIVPGAACAFTRVIGLFQGTGGYAYPTGCGMGTFTNGQATGDQFGFSITKTGQAADKTGKDDNFRGLFVSPDGSLYVTKGSGSNGVNTVYRVGAAGALANGASIPANASIDIVSGFPTAPAANLTSTTPVTGTLYPFGIWMPNATTMFVADEGDGVAGDQTTGSGGLWEYTQQANGTWQVAARFTAGLNLGVAYGVNDTASAYNNPPKNYTTTPDGLRSLTGRVNADGSYTLYAVTSTIGNSLGTTFDAGADSNQLVTITVQGATSTAGFTLLQTAPYGQVLRGVAIVPTAA